MRSRAWKQCGWLVQRQGYYLPLFFRTNNSIVPTGYGRLLRISTVRGNMAKKYVATLPDGAKAKRTSPRGRIYTHLVCARARKVGGGVEEKLTVVGWCGRHDLAVKLAKRTSNRDWYTEVAIVEVTLL